MELAIRADDLGSDAVIGLLREHLDEMHAITPAGSIHALDLDGMRSPEVSFWSAWQAESLVGCGALKQLNPEWGEIKSMRVRKPHRGKGIAAKLLRFIVAEAKSRGYRRLSLETGSFAAFEPARKLYQRHGFDYCGPFGDYREDPNSAFMTREI